MHAYLNTATSAARQAGNFLMREFDRLRSASDRIPASTEAQQQAEQLLLHKLQTAYPDHGIVTPSVSHNPQAAVVWHIDPLNGLQNYQHNIPHFAIAMAVLVDGKIEHVLIHDPVLDESFSTSRGAKVQLQNQQARISRNGKINKDTVIASNVPQRCPEHVAWRNTGCPVLMLAYTAAGRFDALIAEHLSALEIICGGLLMKTAGGLYSDFAGGETFANGQFLAANRELFRVLVKASNACL